MHFIIKYIDLDTFEKTTDVQQLDSPDLSDEVKKSLAVKNKELLVNPDCFLGIILDYVFDEVGIDDKNRVNYDIVNEKGKRLNVHTFGLDHSGLDIFRDKTTYYVAVTDIDGHVIPMLNRKSKEYVEFREGRKGRSKTALRRSSNRSSKGSMLKMSNLKDTRPTSVPSSSDQSKSKTPDM